MRRAYLSILVGCLPALLLLAGAGPASANWASPGSGASYAGALSLQAPATPTTTKSAQTVTVNWTALTIGGSPASAYVIRRYNTSDVEQTVLSGCDGDRTGTSCVETSVPFGVWRYKVQAKKEAWIGPLSSASADITINPAAPTSVTMNGAGPGNVYVNNANKSTVTVSVVLPAASISTHTVMVEISRALTPTTTASASVSAGANGAVTVTTGPIDTVSPNNLTNGALTVRAKLRHQGGTLATDSAWTDSVPNELKDTVAPDQPTAVAIANGGGAGSAYINNQNQASVDYNVTIPAGANNETTDTVTLSLTSGATLSPTKTPSNPGGIVSLTGIDATSLTDGSVALSATAHDLAGNVSAARTGTTIKDTVAVAQPTSVSLTNGGGTGNAYVNPTNQGGADFTVVLPAGSLATDTITLAGQDAGAAHTFMRTLAGTAGAGSILFSSATVPVIDLTGFNDGSLALSATATDIAGNASAAQTGSTTKDTVAPSAPTSTETRSNSAGAVGTIRQGTGYYLYANTSDVTSGIQTLVADDSSVNAAAPSTLSVGSYTVASTAYGFRSAVLTAKTPLTTGSTPSYTLTATDAAGNATAATLAVTIETYASTVLATPGLIGYWRLGETSGTDAADEKAANPGFYWAGSGYTLAQPSPLAGDSNGAVDLDGITGFAYAPHSAALTPTAAVSIEAWVNPDSLTGTQWFVVKDTFYYLYIADGAVIFGVATTTLGYQYVTTTSVTTGSWQHLVGTYDGTTLNLYRNGVNVATAPASGPIAVSTGALFFGVYGPPASGYYDGDLDEIALYGSGLSAATAFDHYESGRGS